MNGIIFPDNYLDDIARVSASTNYFSPVLDQVFEIIEPVKKLLDIGCGTGLFANDVKKRTGCELHGIDGSPYALQKAESMEFKSLTLIDDFNADVLSFASNQFNFCLCKDLLEHLLDPEFVVKEAQRVLQKNGYLLAHVPNHFSFVGRLRFLFSNELDTYNYFPGAKRWNFPHIRFFTYESFLEMFEINGFRIVQNLSHHFYSIPAGRLIPTIALKKRIALANPSQFSEGFCILLQKV